MPTDSSGCHIDFLRRATVLALRQQPLESFALKYSGASDMLRFRSILTDRSWKSKLSRRIEGKVAEVRQTCSAESSIKLSQFDNGDRATIASFGDEWSRFDQSKLDENELRRIFGMYFRIFPWHLLPDKAEGFDMGCGSGRWAKQVLPRVGLLNCIDPSADALVVAKRNLSGYTNVRFLQATTGTVPLRDESQDFGYSLGVLHHVSDTQSAMDSCVRLLKRGAPFLVYLYYNFDNRPAWFVLIWRASELVRRAVSIMPPTMKNVATDLFALTVYWPLAKLSWLAERLRINIRHMPLYGYRNCSFYTMRTDARDRFGTPVEKRFTRSEITAMMERSGLNNIIISASEPFWCAIGTKR
jgi:ubiquinone/menaquinone biosynthesis C-methylase UbiE